MTWPIMSYMCELAFTRSEPEAKTDTMQPRPDALEVQDHIAQGKWQGHQCSSFWRMTHLKLLK